MMLNKVSLNTIGLNRIGLNRIGKPSRGSSDRPYIDPEVLASLKAVCICYGKSNDDPDRAIVKNLVDPDNPFVISNAAYTEGSGYADKDSPYYGAFVTDGIDDLITSTKTAEEMGITNEVTVVSMIHQIGGINSSAVNYGYTNYFRGINQSTLRNNATGLNKTGIYGYSATNYTPTVINNILGDKNDYTTNSAGFSQLTYNNVFSVEGYKISSTIAETSQVAWYWTIIANKALTTDQINQVIAYFNLDRTLRPDILCDVKKQGITNENHAEFGDKLIDFSGNGRDIQLNNIAWKGDSGIGKYEVDFLDSSIWNSSNSTITSSKIDCKNAISHIMLLYYSVGSKEYPDIPSFKVIKTGADIDYSYIDETGSPKSVKIVDGVNILPASHNTLYSGSGRFCGFGNPGMGNSVTITQIPSHAGGLCLNGINDFGKVTGMPIYKDYTFIIEREFLNETFPNQVCLVSKSKVASEIENGGAFIVDNISVNSIINPYSFYKTTSLPGLNTFDRQIVFQSKYKYLDKDIAAGTATDSDTLWLGTFRDNDSRFANVAIYSLMSFPYSMSEFLIERQLKKHKLGTLYPNMVEFRPIIKQDDRIKNVKYYKLNETADYIDLNIGDYIPVGQRIAIVVDLEEPYKITSITSSSLTDVEIRKAGGQNYAYDILGYVTDKSPQKITMDIQVDSSLVQWNPVVESNAEYQVVDFYIDTYPAVVGNYYLISSKLRVAITTKGAADEVTSLTVNGVSLGTPSINGNRFTFNGTLPDKSPQNINIAIDEYIRFEDIVQPYPVLLRFNDENGNEVSWGGKFRVGSTITRIGSIADPESNLLNGLYSVSGLSLNGKAVTSSTSIVEKQMVFKTTATYLLDNNEPKCILSPRLLRIPNSSYKILGYIPDISGHGNHGKINNSAYAGMSGANGYVENFNNWIVSKPPMTVEKEELQVHISYIGTSYKELPMFEYSGPINNNYSLTVDIQGIPDNVIGKFIHNNGFVQEVTNGTNTIKFSNSGSWYGFTFYREDNNIIGNCNITIEQIGEYEGAYCLDGVDDHITIPTVTGGGKQVLMKVNNNTINSMLYDQRSSGASPNSLNSDFAIYNTNTVDNNLIAYQSRLVGKTYIDGILNTNITCEDLLGVLHNITITCDIVVPNNGVVPNIGRGGVLKDLYSKVALYDFMLFDEISTDDKIKELNEYVGIEGNTDDLFNETN